MKKSHILTFLLLFLTSAYISVPTEAKTIIKYKQVVPAAPKATAAQQAQINQYKQGNYTGAMIEFEKMLKNNPKDDLSKYYLALCYTQLGYKEKAKALYTELSEKTGTNEVIKYYSAHAVACLGSKDSKQCTTPTVPKQAYKVIEDNTTEPTKLELPEELKEETTEANSSKKDIEDFIKSGKQIHPAAMDAITKERMERKLQEDEYKRIREQSDGIKMDIRSYNQMPTEEEIASALDVFSRLGINPFTRQNEIDYLSNNSLSQYPYTNQANIQEIMMLNQLIQSNMTDNINYDLINYGI